jgi:multiple sugar transport system substrate-binding protein
MKKYLGYMMTGIMGISLLAGCGGSADEASKTDSAKTETVKAEKGDGKTEQKKDVSLWYYWETEKHQVALNKLIDEFNSSQDTIEVEAEYIPFADFKKRLSIGVTAQDVADIVIIDGPDHASYASMGIFADLTEKLADWEDLKQYYEGPLNSCKLNDKLYGIPFGSNCLALYYNEDMLKAAGCEVPTTWDELKDVAAKTTQGNVKGFGVSAPQNEEGTFQFMPWLWSTGASSYEINSPGGIKALTLIQDLVKPGSMSKEIINWTQGDVMNQFISGNLAMMLNGPWQVPTMRQEVPDLKWNVAAIPKDAEPISVLGGENFGIVDGDRVDESLEFIKFAASPEKIKTYIDEFGYIAARKDVAETQFTDDKIMKTFAETMQYAKPRGPHENWPKISDAISTALAEVITEVSDPETAAAKAQSAIDPLVNK